MNGYDLSKKWFNFCVETDKKIDPRHHALFFYCVEQCNRLRWKKQFNLTASIAMEVMGVSSYNTYSKTLKDLVEFGFIIMVRKSKNQWSSNVIALSNIDEARDEARDAPLDVALLEHVQQHEQLNKTSKLLNSKTYTLIVENLELVEKNLEAWIKSEKTRIPTLEEFIAYAIKKKPNVNQEEVRLKYESWVEAGWKCGPSDKKKPIKIWKSTLTNTLPFIGTSESQMSDRLQVTESTIQSAKRRFDESGKLRR